MSDHILFHLCGYHQPEWIYGNGRTVSVHNWEDSRMWHCQQRLGSGESFAVEIVYETNRSYANAAENPDSVFLTQEIKSIPFE